MSGAGGGVCLNNVNREAWLSTRSLSTNRSFRARDGLHTLAGRDAITLYLDVLGGNRLCMFIAASCSSCYTPHRCAFTARNTARTRTHCTPPALAFCGRRLFARYLPAFERRRSGVTFCGARCLISVRPVCGRALLVGCLQPSRSAILLTLPVRSCWRLVGLFRSVTGGW